MSQKLVFPIEYAKLRSSPIQMSPRASSKTSGSVGVIGGEIEASGEHGYFKVRIRPFIASVPSGVSNGEYLVQTNRSYAISVPFAISNYPGVAHGVFQDICVQSIEEVSSGRYRAIMVDQIGVARLASDLSSSSTVVELEPMDSGKFFSDEGSAGAYIQVGSELMLVSEYSYPVNNVDLVANSVTFETDPGWLDGYTILISGTDKNDGEYIIQSHFGNTYVLSGRLSSQGSGGIAKLRFVTTGNSIPISVTRAARGTSAQTHTLDTPVVICLDLDPIDRGAMSSPRVILEDMDVSGFDGGPYPIVAFNTSAYDFDFTTTAGHGDLLASRDDMFFVTSVTSASKTIGVKNDPTGILSPGDIITIVSSENNLNNKQFTVGSISTGTIVVVEDIQDAGYGGYAKKSKNKANILGTVDQERWLSIFATIDETGLPGVALAAVYGDIGDPGSSIQPTVDIDNLTSVLLGDVKLSAYHQIRKSDVDYSRKESRTFISPSITPVAQSESSIEATRVITNQLSAVNDGTVLDSRYAKVSGEDILVVNKHDQPPGSPPVSTRTIIGELKSIVSVSSGVITISPAPSPVLAHDDRVAIFFTAANDGAYTIDASLGSGRYTVVESIADQGKDGGIGLCEYSLSGVKDGEFAFIEYSGNKYVAVNIGGDPAAWKVITLNAGCSNVCELSCQVSCQASCENTCQASCECGHEWMPSNGSPTYRHYSRNCANCEKNCDVPSDPLHYVSPTGDTCFKCDTSCDLTCEGGTDTRDATVVPTCPVSSDLPGTKSCKVTCEGVPPCNTSYQTTCHTGCQISCQCKYEVRYSAKSGNGVCMIACQTCDNATGAHEVPCGSSQTSCGKTEWLGHPNHLACATKCENKEHCSTDLCSSSQTFAACSGPSGQTDCICSLNCENSCQLSAQTCCDVGCNVPCKTACDSGCQTACQVSGDVPSCIKVTGFSIIGLDRVARYASATYEVAGIIPSNASTTGRSYVWTVSGHGTITSGQGTAKITVKWNSQDGQAPWVQCVYSNSCSSKTVKRSFVSFDIAYCVSPSIVIGGPSNNIICKPPSLAETITSVVPITNSVPSYTMKDTSWSLTADFYSPTGLMYSWAHPLNGQSNNAIPTSISLGVQGRVVSVVVNFIFNTCGAGGTVSKTFNTRVSCGVVDIQFVSFSDYRYVLRAVPCGIGSVDWVESSPAQTFKWYKNGVQFAATREITTDPKPMFGSPSDIYSVVATNVCDGVSYNTSSNGSNPYTVYPRTIDLCNAIDVNCRTDIPLPPSPPREV